MPEFTPVEVVDRSKEKDWAYKLGLMDWDDTKIVFTKRSLIDFLKCVDVTVDTNYTQISKLPRYAEFGRMTAGSSAPAANPVEASAAAPAAPERVPADPSDPSWKPTRRVRTAPGGAQTFSFGDDEPEPATAYPPAAPAPVAVAAPEPAPAPAPVQPAQAESSEYRVVDNDGNLFKPTRRVRTAPGGKDSIGAIFGGA